MSSYVYMKVLEAAPERYDHAMARMSRGTIGATYARVAELAGAARGKNILDVGTGTGGVALACAALGADVVGIDSNAGMLQVARNKAAGATLTGSVRFVAAGALEIEDHFGEATLDAIVACLVLSELTPEERTYALATAKSRLLPGGRLVLADEVRPSSRGRRLWHGLRRLPAAVWTYVFTQHTTHAIEGLADEVRRAGFADVREERGGDDDFAIVSAVRAGSEASP